MTDHNSNSRSSTPSGLLDGLIKSHSVLTEAHARLIRMAEYASVADSAVTGRDPTGTVRRDIDNEEWNKALAGSVDLEQTLFVMDIIKRARKGPLTSTGATVVQVTSGLYNVIGSTPDPKHVPGNRHRSWKRLLIKVAGIPANTPCYVDNYPNIGKGKFEVGGHMTINSDGTPMGTTCYLMPLCKGHNNNDGLLYTHQINTMIELSGYMKGELAATFELRLPSSEPYAVLFFANGSWTNQNLSEDQMQALGHHSIGSIADGADIRYYVLFKRDPQTQSLHYLDEADLLK